MYIYFLETSDKYDRPDRHEGMNSLVVRAESEEQARAIANDDCNVFDDNGLWLDTDLTYCTEIGDTFNQKYPGESEMICCDISTG